MGSKVVNIGIYEDINEKQPLTFDLIEKASRICFDHPRYAPKDIDVLIHVSVYRSNEFVEPAMAAFIQRDLGINPHVEAGVERKTLSFDLNGGSLGFLHGCQTINAMIASKKIKTGLIVGGNSMRFLGTYVGPETAYSQIGIAVLLDGASRQDEGFSSFYFRSFPEHASLYQSHLEYKEKTWYSVINIDPTIEKAYLDVFSQGLRDYLAKNKLKLDYFDYIIPPQVSPRFLADVAKLLGGDASRYIDVADHEGDLMTSSESVALHHIIKSGLATPGKRILVTNVGSGLQFGCAIYGC